MFQNFYCYEIYFGFLFFLNLVPKTVSFPYNFTISHTHQFIIQYNYISGLHVSTVFSHHQALLRASLRLIVHSGIPSAHI